ncbi:STAS domain-containing protein [Sinimarinibacterium sp. CAU 1509]|uniref:STAS domain-containing protein n=1 Tax=Sinimarinibacterium sp. CAU 1509 TaxID=2562283 RepID=UPI0010AB915C|nr:STAS domain-containing protein [Sinimarinibacterium sp. CAU 1509]TJY65188.1 STAS domain-containing protein [Sinimarinibacterium sp. CAU 1509]
MISIHGSLSFDTVSQWLPQADAIVTDGTLDLAEVSQCDSAGAALLLELARRSKQRGSPLQLINAPKQLHDFAVFFGIDTMLGLPSQ